MNNNLLKVYCGELIPNIRYLELLNPNFGFRKRKNIFGDEDIFDNFIDKIVEVVFKAEEADYLLIPHNYHLVKDKRAYLSNFISLAEKTNKKIVVFVVGDSTSHVEIPNSIILRTSQYASHKAINEIIIPAYASDLSYGEPVIYIQKSVVPTIGFCGWAKINNVFKKISFWIRNHLLLSGYLRQGLYFRLKAIGVLIKSSLVKTNFIIRSSYSANKDTIGLNAKQAREEYRKNIIESDFVLAPKGDGNYSVRFYEALSLGRVPILVDTDCPLPLEQEIDYSRFILKISYRNLDKIDEITFEFYNDLTDEKWLEMQKNARRAFDEHLKIDVFFRNLFTREGLSKYLQY